MCPECALAYPNPFPRRFDDEYPDPACRIAIPTAPPPEPGAENAAMTHYTQLWLFSVLVFGIVALPGLDMAFVLGSAIAGGHRRGLSAVAGIVAGGACHVTMAALGISMLVRLLPGTYEALLLAGAVYIAWIGWSLLRSREGFGPDTATGGRPDASAFRRGMLTCLLNPKAYLFTLAVFPQFLHPEYGPIWTQAMLMWLIIAVNQAGVYGTVALMAGRTRRWLQARPAANLLAMRCVGGVLIAAAALTGFEGLHRPGIRTPETRIPTTHSARSAGPRPAPASGPQS